MAATLTLTHLTFAHKLNLQSKRPDGWPQNVLQEYCTRIIAIVSFCCVVERLKCRKSKELNVALQFHS